MSSGSLKRRIDALDMSPIDFNVGMSKIESFFDRPYTIPPKDWLYKQVKYLRSAEWVEMCQNAAGGFDRLPSINQLMQVFGHKIRASKAARVSYISVLFKQQGLANCNYCNHTGIMDARLIARPNEALYAFRCPNCEFANLMDLSRDIEPWHERLSGTLQPLFRRPKDEKDKIWLDIYRHGGKLAGLLKAMSVGPEVYYQEMLNKEIAKPI